MWHCLSEKVQDPQHKEPVCAAALNCPSHWTLRGHLERQWTADQLFRLAGCRPRTRPPLSSILCPSSIVQPQSGRLSGGSCLSERLTSLNVWTRWIPESNRTRAEPKSDSPNEGEQGNRHPSEFYITSSTLTWTAQWGENHQNSTLQRFDSDKWITSTFNTPNLSFYQYPVTHFCHFQQKSIWKKSLNQAVIHWHVTYVRYSWQLWEFWEGWPQTG